MKDFKARLAIVAALCLVSIAVPASADPLKNIVLARLGGRVGLEARL